MRKVQYTWNVIILASLIILQGCNYGKNPDRPAPGDPLPPLKAVTNGTEPGRIVDSNGRQVLLRGVNVNSHIEYWQYDPDINTNYPLTEKDVDMIASMGWNMVHFVLAGRG